MNLSLEISDSTFEVSNGQSILIIDKISGNCKLNKSILLDATIPPKKLILGILGILRLPHSNVLIVATKSELRGKVGDGSPVYQITDTEMIPFTAESQWDQEYIQLVKQHLKDATLFYSPYYDLTCNRQLQFELETQGKPTLVDEFMWNAEISWPISQFPEFIFPVIYGVFGEASLQIGGNIVDFVLISRRSRFRAGTRYFRRGLDSDGHAANFNETEQIVTTGAKVYSFLQTRGSVPAQWSEINNLKYRPQLRVGELAGSVEAASRHFAEQEQRYGEQFLVNLVNQTGYEKPIKELYEQVVHHLKDPKLHYVYFDFHHECSKMRWHRVQLLVDTLKSLGLDRAGYFETEDGIVMRQQLGVVRTNCMDCLDRTNVVQSTLALYQLEQQLHSAGVLPKESTIKLNSEFMAIFRRIWADNADGVSCAYSGTGALKTDFTRTGKRTKLGALQDFVNSVVRYLQNNFRDGPRQDGFSLFLGEFKPTSLSSPFVERRPLLIQSVPYIAAFFSLVSILSILYPSEAHSKRFNIIVTSFCSVVAGLSLKLMFANGLQYVNWPKLSTVTFVHSTKKGYQISEEYADPKLD